MEHILITGANGLLGQKIIAQLIGKKDVKVLATSHTECRIPIGDFHFEIMDVTNEDDVSKIFKSFKPTAVIHTAAMTNVDACESETEKCYALNVKAVENIAKASKNVGAHLVHISTDFIFDGTEGPYSEDDYPNPLSNYGKSKWQSEEVLSTSGVSFCILRTMLLFGVECNGKSNIVLWAKKALEKGEEIRVVDDQFRSATLADSLAEACISAVEKRALGVFHVSGSSILSIRQMVSEIARFWNLDESKVMTIKTASLGQPAPRPPYTGFILDRAIRELDFKPLTFVQALEFVDAELKNQ